MRWQNSPECRAMSSDLRDVVVAAVAVFFPPVAFAVRGVEMWGTVEFGVDCCGEVETCGYEEVCTCYYDDCVIEKNDCAGLLEPPAGETHRLHFPNGIYI